MPIIGNLVLGLLFLFLGIAVNNKTLQELFIGLGIVFLLACLAYYVLDDNNDQSSSPVPAFDVDVPLAYPHPILSQMPPEPPEGSKTQLQNPLECRICNYEYSHLEDFLVLGCGGKHTICRECCIKWFKEKKSCPMCVQRIDSTDTLFRYAESEDELKRTIQLSCRMTAPFIFAKV